jgi:hypothetical protein
VRFYDDFSSPLIADSKPSFRKKWPALWLKRAVGWLHSPFEKSMFLDNDVSVCPGFERLFETYLDSHHLFSATIAPHPFGSRDPSDIPIRSAIPAKEFSQFPERNLGVVLAATSHPKVIELLTLFRDVYVRHTNDMGFHNPGDQVSMRESLFTLRVYVRDTVIPANIGCRYTMGCDDKCLTVHRHWDRDKSGKNIHSPKYLAKMKSRQGNKKNP